MYNYLSVIITFFFVRMAVSQEITATQKIPEKVLPGTEYIAEIMINKDINTSYLKFSQRLPPSFTATEINSKNGKFSFKDGLVKIAWIFPPAEKQFTISFKVTVAKEDAGEKIIKGRVYYFFNIHKKFFQLTPHTIRVIADSNTIEKDTIITIDSIKKTQNTPKLHLNPSIYDTIKTSTATIENITIKAAPVPDKKTYRVQILATRENKNYKDIPELFYTTDDKGITKYFSGNFKTYEEASVRKKYLISIGFEGAFIVAFENNNTIIKKE